MPSKETHDYLNVGYRQSSQIVYPTVQAPIIGSPVNNTIATNDYVTYGSNVSSWRKRIRDGSPATTSLTGQKQFITFRPSTLTMLVTINDHIPASRLKRRYKHIGGCVTVPLGTYATSEADAFNEARMRFMQAARSAQTAMQGGTFIGELAQTIRGIRNPARALRDSMGRYLRDLKRNRNRLNGVPSNRRDSVKRRIIADTWLEHSYHWRPLLADIDNAARALGEYAYRDSRKRIYGAGSQSTATAPLPTQQSWAGGNGLVRWKYQQISTCSVRYIGSVRCEASGSGGYWTESFGLTLSNFVPTVWNLIPYSFLVDYFTNIGTLIDAYSFPIADISWVQQTVKRKSIVTPVDINSVVPSDTLSNKYVLESPDFGHCETVNETVSRSLVNPSSLLPSFRFKVPGIGDWRKWANMSALAATHSRLIPF